ECVLRIPGVQSISHLPLAELSKRRRISWHGMQHMKRASFAAALTFCALCPQAQAFELLFRGELARINRSLCGQVLDFTNNHGKDRRIWSPALNARRDLYVYLPPGYDPCKRYALAIFLHGAAQDEKFFLQDVVKDLDQAIACGQLPPC